MPVITSYSIHYTKLYEVSDAILKSVRGEDLVVRWGGDEFLVLAECEMEP